MFPIKEIKEIWQINAMCDSELDSWWRNKIAIKCYGDR